jgi:hypothetical protein
LSDTPFPWTRAPGGDTPPSPDICVGSLEEGMDPTKFEDALAICGYTPLRFTVGPAGVLPAGPAEPFCTADCWLGLGAAVDGGIALVVMLSVAAALAFITVGEAFAAAVLLPAFAENGLRLATAEKNGLDGTDDVVTHPASANASPKAIKRRPVRRHVRANSMRTFAVPEQGMRA